MEKCIKFTSKALSKMQLCARVRVCVRDKTAAFIEREVFVHMSRVIQPSVFGRKYRIVFSNADRD